MGTKGTASQVKSGFLLAAKTLLAIGTAGLLFVGVEVIRFPSLVRPNSIVGHYPPILAGSVFILIATTVLIVTINRWVTILPGILGYGAFGGLIMLITGHYGKHSVPRLEALIVTLAMVGGALLSSTFQNRTLSTADKIALLAFAFSMAWSASPDSSTMYTAMSIGLGCLLLAWANNRLHRSREAPIGAD